MKTAFRKFILNPLEVFLQDSRAVGITLLICTFVSLFISNWGNLGVAYLHFWNYYFSGTEEFHFQAGVLSLPNSPLLIINEGLMAVFFFLAGMEIKREMLEGELASIKQSLLPVFAALGGMIAPAILFSLINKGGSYVRGWAIPTATDIAFTLGVASLLGKRVPLGLKIFLTALAIMDDLGAIVVIALFYGGKLHMAYLISALCIAAIIFYSNKKKAAFGSWQILLGILLWYCMLNSGIHATVAGVIFAFLIPVDLLKGFENKLHFPVYFLIIPLFALANTAITIPKSGLDLFNSSLSWGVIIGLCIGKPLGISASCYFLVKRKWAELPEGVGWYKIIGAGMLAGIGFTMSIFISNLAFDEVAVENIAKISVLLASFIAITLGYCWFRFEKKPA